MNANERSGAESELSLLEVMLTALDRRGTVLQVVADSEDLNEAMVSLGRLLDTDDILALRAVTDMQVRRWTKEERQKIIERLDELRGELRIP